MFNNYAKSELELMVGKYKLSASVRWVILGKYSNIKPIFAILGC